MQDLATSSSASTELAASAQAKLQEAEEKLAGAEEAAKLAAEDSQQAAKEKVALEEKVSDLQGELGEELLYQGVLEIGKKKLANELLRINDIHQVQNEEVQKLRAENQHKQKQN